MIGIKWEKRFVSREISLKFQEIQAVGGRGVLGQYKSSLYKMLSTVYPEYNWLPWKFSRTMSGFWKVKENQRNFMEWAAKELKLNDIKDWYKVSHKEISKLGGIMLLKEYDYSLPMLLSNVFPDHSWDIFEFDRLPSDTWDTILQSKDPKKLKKFNCCRYKFKERLC